MKTILITGVNGYIGRHVLSSLDGYDFEVIGLDRHIPEDLKDFKTIEADFLDESFNLGDYIEEIPDVCLHLAWRNGFNHRASSHMGDLSGHVKFLEALVDQGLSLLAVMGTMHEVGYWEGPIDESTPCNPQSYYGIAKDALRRTLFLKSEESGLTLQWLRAYYLYGDDVRAQSIFGKVYRAALEGEKAFPFTMGRNKYDFLHIDALADQIAACVAQDEVQGIINCCSGVPVTLAERVEGYIKENGLDIQLEYGAFPDRPYDSPGVWGNAVKIQRIMNSKGC